MFNLYTVKGTRYEMGYQLGKIFSKPINDSVDRFIAMLNNKEINKQLDQAIKLIKTSFPECLEELIGKAKGAKVDERALILMHYPEIYTEPYSCTTVVYKKKDRVLFSHNEDDAHYDNDKVALIKYEYNDHYMMAFTLFNRLSGSCFSYNSYGLVFSCNYLFHEFEDMNNLSRYIISRKIIEAQSIKETLDIICAYRPAQPFSLNVLDANTNNVINSENDLDDNYVTVVENKYARSNHFLTKDNPKMSDNSKWRHYYANIGINSLDEKAEIYDIKKILMYENDEYVKSIFMDPLKYPNIDNTVTMANFSFDSKTKEIIISDHFDHSQKTYHLF